MEGSLNNQKSFVMTREQAREFDHWAINTMGIPGVVLMENAGRNCAELIRDRLKRLSKSRMCIFCGTGNNGGDGYVIARHLYNAGLAVKVVICGDRAKVKGDAKIDLDILQRMNLPVIEMSLAEFDIAAKVAEFAEGADMIVDALFGTGLRGRLSNEFIELIEAINLQKCFTVAVDIPSGLDCDTGQPLGVAIKANCTVTFGALKQGFLKPDARIYTGDVFTASIGIEPWQWRKDLESARSA